MIKFHELNSNEPFQIFKEKYNYAMSNGQKNIEAINISSFSKSLNEVNSRMVNIKIINNTNFIFFTNYESPKSRDFEEHNQVTAVFYWNSVDVQIRFKAYIKKTSKSYNNNYFSTRSKQKNALAISSKQSNIVESYESVVKNYKNSLETENLTRCPKYWGGYSLSPYYFEFWEGNESRINKREVYSLINNNWNKFYLQP